MRETEGDGMLRYSRRDYVPKDAASKAIQS